MLVSGSFLSETVKPKSALILFDKTSLDFIHVDVMDGKFVDNKSYSIGDLKKFNSYTSKPFDVHLMVSNPEKYIDDLCLLNVSYITFHFEAVKKPLDLISHIKNNGVKVGISIKPNTNVSDIFYLLPYVDLILVMSVEPGKSGQKFMESVLYKIEVLKKKIDEDHLNIIVSVDGGINDLTFPLVKEKGVDMVVSSSYLLSGEIERKIRLFKS